MSEDPKVTEARQAVWRAAMSVSLNRRDLAQRVQEGAEMHVIRKLLAAMIPGGEVGYWQLVEAELRR